MAEPINTAVAGVSLMTLAVALFGANAGPYAVILLGSIGGALWALSSASVETRIQGAWLVARCVITAIVLTAFIARFLGPYMSFAEGEAYSIVSFVIGALGNRWQDIFDAIKTRLSALIATGGPKP